jgi:hypothetical protein
LIAAGGLLLDPKLGWNTNFGTTKREETMEAGTQSSPASTQRGFFESLTDTRFDSLITPKLIRFLYVASMIILFIGLIAIVTVSFIDDAGSGVLALVLAPLGALLYLIVIRLYLELIIVTFKIREAADEIAGNTRSRG